MSVKRFGVSIDNSVFEKLDDIVKNEKFANRSRAISFLINEHQNNLELYESDIISGAVILIYDHNNSGLHSKVKSLQHEYSCLIISAQHIHLDSKNCIETINVKGSPEKVLKIANKLKGIKGIKYGDYKLFTIN